MKAKESTLDKMRSRPRFKMYTTLSPEAYAENLRVFLLKNKEEFSGNINRETATITVITENEDYWKPSLALRTEVEEEITAVRGIFGPSSEVWTFFMFLYFIFGILWMVFITLWFVGQQIKSSDYRWGLGVSFIMLGGIALTYFAARWGQQRAKVQMEQLRKFAIDSTLPFEEAGH